MIYIGIDPGLNGAIAVIDPDGKLHLEDTPVLLPDPKKGKREYDEAGMRRCLASWFVIDEAKAVIEKQQAFPGQGVSSTFRTGMGYGIWRGLLAGLQIPYEIVGPRTWKKEMLKDMDQSSKASSLLKAKQLFPTADITLKKHDGRAEALLMAEYLRRRG